VSKKNSGNDSVIVLPGKRDNCETKEIYTTENTLAPVLEYTCVVNVTPETFDRISGTWGSGK
jgi:hypothetical protein